MWGIFGGGDEFGADFENSWRNHGGSCGGNLEKRLRKFWGNSSGEIVGAVMDWGCLWGE